MRHVSWRATGRGNERTGEVPDMRRVRVVAATVLVLAAAAAGPLVLIWIAEVGGWLRFTVALVLFGVAAPYLYRETR